MKKKSVNLVTAAGVLVVLSGAYVGVKSYVAQQEAKEAESEEEEETKEIISIASEDVESLKFIIDKKEVTFEKDSDSWVKSDEKTFPVNQSKMDSLAGKFASIEAERVLEDVEDISEYELDQPENTITVTTSDGETTTIKIGMENNSTSQQYIELNKDASTVYVVNYTTFSSFDGTLYDYAESNTFPTIDSSAVSKIQVNGKENSYEIAKDESESWYVTDKTETESDNLAENEPEKADSAKTTSLASALSSVAYADFVDYDCSEDELSQYGLGKPYAEIIVDYQEEVEVETLDDEAEVGTQVDAETETEADVAVDVETEADVAVDAEADAETKTEVEADADMEDVEDTEESAEPLTEMVDRQIVIQIGDENSDGSRYVRVNDSNEIYTISNDTLDTFINKSSADFWNMTVSYLSVNNLEKLSLNYNDEEYVVNVSRETSGEDEEEESSTSYSVTLSYDVNGKEIENTTFTKFYNKLINMSAQKRLVEPFESNVAPEMTAEFTDLDENKMFVEYYTYDTNYYAAVIDRKTYLVNKMNVKEMFTALDSLVQECTDGIDTEETKPVQTETEEAEEKETEEIESEVDSSENVDLEETASEENDPGETEL